MYRLNKSHQEGGERSCRNSRVQERAGGGVGGTESGFPGPDGLGTDLG